MRPRRSRASSSSASRDALHARRHLGGASASATARPRRLRCRPGPRRPPQVAHVLIDGVAEQHHLHHGNADDHPEGEPVAAELPHLLARDGQQAATAKLMQAARASGGGDEDVLQGGGRRLDARLDAGGGSSGRDQPARRLVRAPDHEHAQRSRAARRCATGEDLASASTRAGRAQRSASTSTTVASMSRRQLARCAFGHQRAASRMARRVAALGFVHVVGGDQDRGAVVDQLEQALPEVAATLRVDGTGGLVEEQQSRLVQRGRRQGQALVLAAAEGAGALARQVTQAIALARCSPIAVRRLRPRP